MTRESKDLIVGLDIGTSKVVAVVAEMRPDGHYEIVGLGQHESRGLKKGVVVNIETTVASIQQALEEAELMADCKIRNVYTGIAGSHIRSFNSIGMVAIKDKEVTDADVARVIETAKAVNIPTDQQILHVLPQEFIIDGQEDIREPIGMSGVRLDVKVHIVTGAVSAAQNIIKCVRRCGLEVQDLILQPLASSSAVLTEDEKELGVALVDIGGGTTDIAIFTGGSIRHTAVIPIAGDQITSDIAMALRTPTPDAEDIKVRYGIAKQVLAEPSERIEVPGIGDRGPRSLSRQAVVLARAAGDSRVGIRGIAVVRGGHHRRHEPAAWPGRTGRRHFSEAGAPGRAAVLGWPGRRGQDAPVCHRARIARGSSDAACAGAQGGRTVGFVQGNLAPHERVVRR